MASPAGHRGTLPAIATRADGREVRHVAFRLGSREVGDRRGGRLRDEDGAAMARRRRLRLRAARWRRWRCLGWRGGGGSPAPRSSLRPDRSKARDPAGANGPKSLSISSQRPPAFGGGRGEASTCFAATSCHHSPARVPSRRPWQWRSARHGTPASALGSGGFGIHDLPRRLTAAILGNPCWIWRRCHGTERLKIEDALRNHPPLQEVPKRQDVATQAPATVDVTFRPC